MKKLLLLPVLLLFLFTGTLQAYTISLPAPVLSVSGTTLHWTEVPSATNGYRIIYGPPGGAVNVTGTSYSPTPELGQTVSYAVRSREDYPGAGHSTFSNAVEITWPSESAIAKAPLGPSEPSGGWSVEYADSFQRAIGSGAGQDNTWYPNYDSGCLTGDCGDEGNGNELQFYNTNQVSVGAEGLKLQCEYVAAGIKALGEERKYRCGAINGSTNSGYRPFVWWPKEGNTLVFQAVMKLPLNTGEADPGFWSHGGEEFDTPEFGGWDSSWEAGDGWAKHTEAFFAWFYGSSVTKDGFSITEPPASPETAFHTYTTEIYPVSSGKYNFSVYIDGIPWRTNVGPVSVQELKDHMILQYALRKCSSSCPAGEGNFTGAPRQFDVKSVAVYEDTVHKGVGVENTGLAPGTSVE